MALTVEETKRKVRAIQAALTHLEAMKSALREVALRVDTEKVVEMLEELLGDAREELGAAVMEET